MRARPAVALGLWLAVLACASADAQDRRYTYVPVGSFGTNAASGSGLHDLNEAGRAAGYAGVTTRGYARASTSEDGRVTNLGELNRGGQSIAWGINDAGHVVGQTHVSRYEPSHLFLHRDGKMVDLGTGLGSGSMSYGADINQAGQIVGDRSASAGAPTRGFMWRDGVFTDLGSLGGTGGAYNVETSAEAINDRGQIVGSSVPARGYPLHAFIWENGRMRDLGVLGPDTEATQAFAVNNRGQVAGWSQARSLEMEGFIWEDGRMRPLGDLGGSHSRPFDVNDNGDIVGTSTTPESHWLNTGHAFLWSQGTMHDLNDLVHNLPANVVLETAEAINEDGVIVGHTCVDYCDPGKTARDHAYMLIPDGIGVPTPKPTLVDSSGYARTVTVAGSAPTAAPGRWGDGLRFSGGRLQTPQFEIPLAHGMSAYIRPDAGRSEQMILGQWRATGTPGDGGAVTKLAYDGANQRVTYSVVDATGRVTSTASPLGSYGAPGEKFRLVTGGIAKTGQLVLSIDGVTYCSSARITSLDGGDGSTPFTVGAAADGSTPFAGVIEGANITPTHASTTDYRLPPWEGNPAFALAYFFFDADQRPPDLNDLAFPLAPTPPKKSCRATP